MKRLKLLILSIVCVSLIVDAQLTFNGLCGSDLKAYIRENFSPQRVVTPADMWEVFRRSDVNADGTVLDRYSTNRYYFPTDGYSSPLGMTIDRVLNLSWWGTYGYDMAENDMYNIVPCNLDVPVNKRDYMPGVVAEVIYSNGVWSIGWGRIDDERIIVYNPPQGYEGDFARIIMYMATIYPADRWSGQGVNFFVDGNGLSLNGYSKQLLLQWHALDPVSDIERNRNEVISWLQGNRNPYVDYPQIVDHIWGSKSSEPFTPNPEEGEEHVKTPLRAVYSLSTDSHIDLYSPHIPEGAIWKINGEVINEECVDVRSLGVGVHELRFESPSLKGKLNVKIIE